MILRTYDIMDKIISKILNNETARGPGVRGPGWAHRLRADASAGCSGLGSAATAGGGEDGGNLEMSASAAAAAAGLPPPSPAGGGARACAMMVSLFIQSIRCSWRILLELSSDLAMLTSSFSYRKLGRGVARRDHHCSKLLDVVVIT